jgi:hypothetical protein
VGSDRHVAFDLLPVGESSGDFPVRRAIDAGRTQMDVRRVELLFQDIVEISAMRGQISCTIVLLRNGFQRLEITYL